MITDYLDPSAPSDYQADLCVIGAGPAGIAIARAFIGTSTTVCLIEGGGLAGEDRSQSLYDGTSAGNTPFDGLPIQGRVTRLWKGGREVL